MEYLLFIEMQYLSSEWFFSLLPDGILGVQTFVIFFALLSHLHTLPLIFHTFLVEPLRYLTTQKYALVSCL